MNPAPRALSLDLDDTLWPIWPVIERAEAALDVFLRERCPRTADKFPIAKMRELRNLVATEHPQFAHDFTHQRKLSLLRALRESGDDEAHAEDAFDAFYAARNAIEFYPDAIAALQRLAARVPVAALTNGNADLERIGIANHFAVYVAARDAGHAKPDTPIFHATCERLGVAPHELLHVGDDPELDIAGAQRAGVRSCWINRHEHAWPEHLPRPELEFADLHALADWLETQPVFLENA